MVARTSHHDRSSPSDGYGAERRGGRLVPLEAESDAVCALAELQLDFVATARCRANRHRSAPKNATALAAGAWRRFWERSRLRVRHPGHSSHPLEAGSDVVCAVSALWLDLVAAARTRENRHRNAPKPAATLSAAWSRRFRARSAIRVGHPGRSSCSLEAASDVACALAELQLDFVAAARCRANTHRSTAQPAAALSAGAWRRFRARSASCMMHPGRRSHPPEAASGVVCALVAFSVLRAGHGVV